MASAVVNTVGEISLTLEAEWLITKCKAKPEIGQMLSCLDT